MNKDVIKSRMQSLITLYISERDQAIADFNMVLLNPEYKEGENITKSLKPIIDRLIKANSGISETQEMWARMNVVEAAAKTTDPVVPKSNNEETK